IFPPSFFLAGRSGSPGAPVSPHPKPRHRKPGRAARLPVRHGSFRPTRPMKKHLTTTWALCALVAPWPVLAQPVAPAASDTATTPAALAKYDKNKDGVLDPTERAAMEADMVSAPQSDDETIKLTPFEVTASTDVGYQATETLAGTRIRTDLRDVGSAIS